MATEDSTSKRSGLGWIPKLSLAAVVIAFGYLYLSSNGPGSTGGDTEQMVAADASGVEADAGGLQEQFMTKLGEFTSSAEGAISDATKAGTDFIKGAVDKVKALSGATDESVAETSGTEPIVADEAPAEPEVVEPIAAAAPEAAPTSAAVPTEERPAASGFDRHYAPLPAAQTGATAQKAETSLEVSAPVEASGDSVPMTEEAEATVFAESLMSKGSPAAAASAPTEEAVVTTAPPAQEMVPAFAPMVPVVPQPYASTDVMPAPGMGSSTVRGIDPLEESAAQYRARMMAEYENMRRVADQRAREYWERMQAGPGPMAAPMVYPGYGPAYGPPAYPR
jgi:hypothetical protein